MGFLCQFKGQIQCYFDWMASKFRNELKILCRQMYLKCDASNAFGFWQNCLWRVFIFNSGILHHFNVSLETCIFCLQFMDKDSFFHQTKVDHEGPFLFHFNLKELFYNLNFSCNLKLGKSNHVNMNKIQSNKIQY